ncbi:uncharacterized protein LOC142771403 isoform X2 [Rhipicephalus microplus]|uniref:uncharacterized protein LOC142771403 isoform X2 n=1 Tax=Rhipicephalus microplus TaxID=6941 RepID=UPI003F6B9DAA
MKTGVFEAILILMFTDITPHTAGWNMREMEPIWTVKTTRSRHIKCEVDQVQSVTPMSLSINRCVFIRDRRCDMGILGVLDTQHKERMTIFHRGTLKRTESILYMAFDHSCSVLKVESLIDWDFVYFDLRMRNSSLFRRPLQNCQNYFQRVIGHQRPMYVYKPDCQRLLKQGE